MMLGKKVAKASLTLIAIAAVTIILTSVALASRDRQIYPSNCYIEGIGIGGLSRSRTEQMLAGMAGRQKWDLKFPDQTITLSAAEYGIEKDEKATLDQLDSTLKGRTGIEGLLSHAVSRGRKNNIAMVYRCNRNLLYEQLNQLQSKVNRPAVNARILYNKGLLEYIPHQNGYLLDLDATAERIIRACREGDQASINAAVVEIYPAVKMEDIKSVKDVIGADAVSGLSSAAVEQIESTNGSIIMPGQIFTVPIKDSSSPGIQRAAAAVIKACENAGLKVMDSARFIIQNNLNHPVLLSVVMCDTTAQIKVLGCQTEPGKKIRLTTEEQELPPQVKVKEDRSLAPQQRVIEQKGSPGLLIRTYRLVTIKNKVVEKTLLAQEFHPGTDTIINQGPNGNSK